MRRVFPLLFLLAAVGLSADEVRLRVMADTSLQAHQSEVSCNSGATSSIRIKGNEHFMLAKFDLAPIKGWDVESARLFLHPSHPHMLRTVGVSTIATDWEEGTGTGGAAENGCTFLRANHPDDLWAGPGSDFTHVSLTNGNTRSFYTDVKEVTDGWLSIDIDPWLVYAMTSGASCGLCISDEKGQTRANNDVHSREQNGYQPYLLVTGAPEQVTAERPEITLSQAQPESRAAGYQTGALSVSLRTKGAFTIRGTYAREGEGGAMPIPRRLIRLAEDGSATITIPGLSPGARYSINLCGVDRHGNSGPMIGALVRASAARPMPDALPVVERERPCPEAPPTAEGLCAWACPAWCKVNPRSGAVLEESGAQGYSADASSDWRRANPVWDAGTVRLAAARGEVLATQVVVENLSDQPREVDLEYDPAGFPSECKVFRNWYVKDSEWFAEYMIPLGDASAQIPAPDNAVPGQRNQSFTLIWWIPPDTTPGLHRVSLKVGEGLSLPIEIEVHNFTLPAETSFEVDLNCYGPVYSDRDFDEYLEWERVYYRAAHALRSTLNPLPYSQSGQTYRGFVPALEGSGAEMKVADWSEYDRHYGPYLDGSAFGGIRAGVPITHMYLPFHENWPSPIAEHYSAGNDIRKYPDNIVAHALSAPPVEEAFDQDFQDAFVAVTRQFVEHCRERGWARTEMQCYQNNKYYFKDEKTDFRGTSWWLLDEPMHRDDWLALRFFARMFREGARNNERFVYRGDISRPQWQRDWLDGLADVICVSSALFTDAWHCQRMADQWGAEFWHYGTANEVRASNLNGVAWALRAWIGGADGILPWNTIGGEGALTTPTATALLIPGSKFGIKGPLVSLRLLALCRGQQDVEYLNLLAKKRLASRDEMRRLISEHLTLNGEHRQAWADDAGTMDFGALRWEDLDGLRRMVASELSK
ncbi:MAG: hypothetical protein KBI47_16735 [Armatimonadetes bacterium]|nr:hypothetical protein [Armatimonadota bacterium]